MGTRTLTSLEEYERLPNDGIRYEIDEGELVPVTFPKRGHTQIQHLIQYSLLDYAKDRNLGSACVESPYLLSTQPLTLRAPDVSFITESRLAGTPQDAYIQGAPELAVEIVSPSDTPAAMERKVRQYLAAGALAVWVVYPAKREVHIFERGGAASRVLLDGDTIEGAGPLAGFSAPVSSFFDEPRRK